MSDSPIQGALLRCEGLLVGYGGKALLPAVDLEIASGEFWSVIGRNGSGKSTWFRTLLGLIPPVGGQVVWPNGKVKLTYVAQRIRFDDLIPVSVEQVVAMGLERGWSFLGPRPKMTEKVADALEAVKADHLADRTFRSLSEGQKQRVLLARMVASGAQVALLDEPTAAMDAEGEHEIFQRFRDLKKDRTAILITHRFGTVRMADRIVVIDGGRIVEEGSHEALMMLGGLYARMFSLQAEGLKVTAD